MFGLGPSELVMVFLLVLLLFGPSKLPQMARDIGRFVGEARRSIDEFKEELTATEEDEEEEGNSYRRSGKNTPAKKDEKTEEAGKESSKAGTSSESSAKKEEEYDF
jgi:TatA/E family protein of Tat protein translocase